jgi:hypothetical protein
MAAIGAWISSRSTTRSSNPARSGTIQLVHARMAEIAASAFTGESPEILKLATILKLIVSSSRKPFAELVVPANVAR